MRALLRAAAGISATDLRDLAADDIDTYLADRARGRDGEADQRARRVQLKRKVRA